MKFRNPNARFFVPDGRSEGESLGRTTHLGIGAHPDDLEFMALHGILECWMRNDRGFGGVTVTHGGGSARSGSYAGCSDVVLMELRGTEQENAARIGHYAFMAQLGYSSAEVNDPASPALKEELAELLDRVRPEVLYTHNPADKHDTHIGVMSAVLQALRSLPAAHRPRRVLGCEVWRGLDWMSDETKVILDVSGHDDLAIALNGVFDSQIAGGKRYDLAVQGRKRANATFLNAHTVDPMDQAWFAMDLTPLVEDEHLDVRAFVQGHILQFARDVDNKLGRYFAEKD